MRKKKIDAVPAEQREPFVLPGHKMTEAFAGFRFRFYPCGYQPQDYENLVYVKYKPIGKQTYDQDIRILGACNDYVHYDLPDRELLFTRSAMTLGGDRPFNKPSDGSQWDKAFTMNPITTSGDDLPFDRYLINPHAYPNQRVEPKTRMDTTAPKPDKICLADSGGFQLGHGGMDFIHPDDVIGFYKRNADEGIVLDIPARALADEEILKHTARVQNLNARYMKERLPKDFRMATVLHGQRIEFLDKFRRDVEEFDADFPIACISGILRVNLVEAVHKILYIISTGAEYQQYHILGVCNPPLLAALIRMAYLLKQSGRDVLITSDSSSPIGFSVKHTYYNQPAFHNALQPTRYGTKLGSNKDAPAGDVLNVHRRLSSTDALSQLTGGYQDMIAAYNIPPVTRSYVMYINQIEVVRYINQMCTYADKLDHKTYKALVNQQYAGSMHSHVLQVALDYMEAAFDVGIERAYERFKFYMPFFTGHSSLHKFPAIGETEDEGGDHENSVKRKRLIRVIKNYLDFHKTGAVPDVVKAKAVPGKGGRTLTLKI